MPSKPKQLPSGLWISQVSTGQKNEKGRYIYTSASGTTANKAYKEALILEEEYKSGRRNPNDITVLEAIDLYIQKRTNIASPSTIRGYDVIKRNYFQSLMPMKARKLTADTLQTAINNEAEHKSPKTIQNAYGLLHSALKEYVVPWPDDLFLPTVTIKERPFLEMEEILQLVRASEGTVLELPILLSVWLSLRTSEIRGLRWDCVDFGRNVLHIHNTVVPNKDNQLVERPTTKTKRSTRTLDCPSYILGKLEEKQPDPTQRTGLVFGKELYNLGNQINRLCKKTGIPQIGAHGLRHTNASVMALLGIPFHVAMERGGWDDEVTMRKRYEHVFSTARKDASTTIDLFFETLLGIKKETVLSSELSSKK